MSLYDTLQAALATLAKHAIAKFVQSLMSMHIRLHDRNVCHAFFELLSVLDVRVLGAWVRLRPQR